MKTPSLPSACALAFAAAAHAQTPPPAPAPAPQQIEITAGRESDTEQRRNATAAKIVVGRDEIEKYGDATLGEVLRRLPGVTTPGAPGRGGPPRLRGLGNGYTQFLIDGQRVPPGFSFESITPDQIERIEILRAPTAETGARAIAGTINIVTREGWRRRVNEVHAGVGVENGQTSPGGSWTRNDSAGPLTYNLSASAFDFHRRSRGVTDTVDTDAATGDVLAAKSETGATQEHRRNAGLSGRLQWRLGEGGDMLTLNPSAFHTEGHSDRVFTLVQRVGVPDYAGGDSVSDNSFTTARLAAQWRQRLGDALRLELSGYAGGFRARGSTLRTEQRADGGTRAFATRSGTRERSANAAAKLTHSAGEVEREHALAGGVEAEAVRRRESGSTQDDGRDVDVSTPDNLQANSLRLAAYVQDEWNPTPQWALNAGLRWEQITTRGDDGAGNRPRNESRVVTPLLHAVWRPDPKARDQLRLSLTRSYRAPALGSLIARPSISPENSATRPDRVGNPDLKPELATGIDLAAERYLAGGGLLSANLFHRRIRDLMRTVVAPEVTTWLPGPQRFVARERNVGNASTSGLELEAKFGLDQLLAGAPRVELRGNAAFYRSRVDGVPGPDNRLDQQAKATANAGADYRLRALPLALGGNLNWVPGYATQQDESRRTTVGAKRIVDVYALWTFNPGAALRLMANNLLHADYASTNSVLAGRMLETATSDGPSYTQVQLRLELKL